MGSFGQVTSIVERPLGTTLALAASAGAGTITVDDVSKLNWPDGALRIGTELHFYTVDVAPDQSVDEIDADEDPDADVGTLSLSGTLLASYDVDEPVVQYQDGIVTERLATVLLPEKAEELVLRVPRGLWDRLAAEIRDREGAETVALEQSDGEWVMTDVIALDPSVDASFVNAATLPGQTAATSAGTAVDSSAFFAEAWSNPANVVASDDNWATAVSTASTPDDIPGNTGFEYPTVASDSPAVGSQNWTFMPEALGAPDDSGAQAAAPSGLNTHYLVLTGFGFAVPVGATITGVQATVIRRNASVDLGFGGGGSGGGPAVQDNLVKLVLAGSAAGSDRSNTVHWPGTFTGISYGGASDKWGNTLTPADVNDPDFGIAISADCDADSAPRIDAVRLKVSYTTPAPVARSKTHFLVASGFPLTVPDEAIPTAITVEVERHASVDSGDNYVADNQVRVVNGSNSSASKTSSGHWPTSDAYVKYGGSDLWGLSWTAAEANALAVWVSADISAGGTASVDHIRVTVAYVSAGDVSI